MMTNRTLRTFVAALLVLLITTPAMAIVWEGDDVADWTNWADLDNWDTGLVPTNVDDVTIDTSLGTGGLGIATISTAAAANSVDVSGITADLAQLIVNLGANLTVVADITVGKLLVGTTPNEGTLTQNDGDISAVNLLVGDQSGLGHFDMFGGTVTLSGNLELGTAEQPMSGLTSEGHMTISGLAEIYADMGTVKVGAGFNGLASVTQTGGLVRAGAVEIGVGDMSGTSDGTYSINAGRLDTWGSIAVDGSGLGLVVSGTGDVNVGADLIIGGINSGLVSIGGNGTIDAGVIFVGTTGGTGGFTQTGGAVTASSATRVGQGGGSFGTYDLSGAGSTLDTGTLYVGDDGGDGSFTQDIGTIVTSSKGIGIGTNLGIGEYTLTDGTISLTSLLWNEGLGVGYDGDGTLNILAGTISTVGGNIAVGLDPSGFGLVNQDGGGVTAGWDFVVGYSGGYGEYNFNAGTLDVANMTIVGSQSGSYGELNIAQNFNTGGMWVGDLLGTGVVTQTGGHVDMPWDLFVGLDAAWLGGGGDGTYDLQAGSLNVDVNAYIGHSGGTGVLNIDSGPVTIGNWLMVGHADMGAYGGTVGIVTQTGGDVSALIIPIGHEYGTGTYNISGGSLTYQDTWIGHLGTGDMTISGTAVVNAWATYVGLYGTGVGTLTQEAGTSLINEYKDNVWGRGNLVFGIYGGEGHYNLNGGNVEARDMWVGGFNWWGAADGLALDGTTVTYSTGTMTMNGGNLDVNGWLHIGILSSSQGTVVQNGGNMDLGTLYVGGSGATGSYTLNGGTVNILGLRDDVSLPRDGIPDEDGFALLYAGDVVWDTWVWNEVTLVNDLVESHGAQGEIILNAGDMRYGAAPGVIPATYGTAALGVGRANPDALSVGPDSYGYMEVHPDATFKSTANANFIVGLTSDGFLNLVGSGETMDMEGLSHNWTLIGDQPAVAPQVLGGKGRIQWSIDSGGARILRTHNMYLGQDLGRSADLYAIMKGGAALTESDTITLVDATWQILNQGGVGPEDGFNDLDQNAANTVFDMQYDAANREVVAVISGFDKGTINVGDAWAGMIEPISYGHVQVDRAGFLGWDVELELTFDNMLVADLATLATWMQGEYDLNNAGNPLVVSDDGVDKITITGLELGDGASSVASWDFGPYGAINGVDEVVVNAGTRDLSIWTGGTSAWETGANWGLGTTPDSDDQNVIVGAAVDVTVASDTYRASVDAGSLTIAGGGSSLDVATKLYVSSTGTLTVGDGVNGGDLSAELVQSAGTLTFNTDSGGVIQKLDIIGGTATISSPTITDVSVSNATLDFNASILGRLDSNLAIVNITGTAASVGTTAALVNTTTTVLAGNQLNAHLLELVGGNTYVEANAILNVGQDFTTGLGNFMTVDAGGTVNVGTSGVGWTRIGNVAGTYSELNIDGDFNTVNRMILGHYGADATLNINSGGSVNIGENFYTGYFNTDRTAGYGFTEVYVDGGSLNTDITIFGFAADSDTWIEQTAGDVTSMAYTLIGDWGGTAEYTIWDGTLVSGVGGSPQTVDGSMYIGHSVGPDAAGNNIPSIGTLNIHGGIVAANGMVGGLGTGVVGNYGNWYFGRWGGSGVVNQTGGSVFIQQAVIGEYSGSGIYNIDGATSELQMEGNLYVPSGWWGGEYGELNISGGATVNVGWGTGGWSYIAGGVNSAGHVDIDGGNLWMGEMRVTASPGAIGTFYIDETDPVNFPTTVGWGWWTFVGVGAGAIGTVEMDGGTVTATGRTVVGYADSTGIFNMSAGTFNNAEGIYLGYDNWFGQGTGRAEFNQDGGDVTTNWAVIGYGLWEPTSTAVYTQTGGTFSAASNFHVGDYGVGWGTYNLEGGTMDITNWFTVGRTGAYAGKGVFNMSGDTTINALTPNWWEYKIIGQGGTAGQTGGVDNSAVGVMNIGWKDDGMGGLVEVDSSDPANFPRFMGAGGQWKIGSGLDQWGGWLLPSEGTLNMRTGYVYSTWYDVEIGRFGGEGTFNLSGGTFDIGRTLYIAGDNLPWDREGDLFIEENRSLGTINQSGGTLNVVSWTVMGNWGGIAEYNQSGGVANLQGVSMADNGGTATISLSGDAVMNAPGGFYMGFNGELVDTDGDGITDTYRYSDSELNITDTAYLNAWGWAELGRTANTTNRITQTGGTIASIGFTIATTGANTVYNLEGGDLNLVDNWWGGYSMFVGNNYGIDAADGVTPVYSYGELNQSGGNIDAVGIYWNPEYFGASGATGVLNHSGGTANFDGFYLGVWGGDGTYNLSGTAVLNTGGFIHLGDSEALHADGVTTLTPVGRMVASGGTWNHTAGDINIGQWPTSAVGSMDVGTDLVFNNTSNSYFRIGSHGAGTLNLRGGGDDFVTSGATYETAVSARIVGDEAASALSSGTINWSIDSLGARTIVAGHFVMRHDELGVLNSHVTNLNAGLKGGAAFTDDKVFTLVDADLLENLNNDLLDVDNDAGEQGLNDSTLFDLYRDVGANEILARLDGAVQESTVTVGGGLVGVTPSASVGWAQVNKGTYLGIGVAVTVTFDPGENEELLAAWMETEMDWGYASNPVTVAGDDLLNTITITGVDMWSSTSYFSWDFDPFVAKKGIANTVLSIGVDADGSLLTWDNTLGDNVWDSMTNWDDDLVIPDAARDTAVTSVGGTANVINPQAANYLRISNGAVDITGLGNELAIGTVVDVDAAGTLTVGTDGRLDAPVVNAAGTVNFANGSLGIIDELNVLGPGTATISSPNIAVVNATGGILDTSGNLPQVNIAGGEVNASVPGVIASVDMTSGDFNLGAGLAVGSVSASGGNVAAGPNVTADSLSISGAIATAGDGLAAGSLRVSSGSLATGGLASADNVDISNGAVTLGGNLTVAGVGRITGGLVNTGADQVTVTGQIVVNDIQARSESGPGFGVRGSDLVAERTLAIGGGTVGIYGPNTPIDPLAHYEFDNAIMLHLDSSGNNNFGSKQGDAAADVGNTPSGLGNSLVLDGDGDYYSLPDLTAEFGNQAASISLWVKLNDDDPLPNVIGDGIPTDPNKSGLVQFSDPAMLMENHYSWVDGAGYFRAFRASPERIWVDPLDMAAGADRTAWHLVTITSDPVDGYKVYQNDQELASAGPGTFEIGGFQLGWSGNFAYLRGNIDDARLFNRGLSAAEVAVLYNQGLTGLRAGGINSPMTHLDVTASATIALDTDTTATLGNLDLVGGATLTATNAAKLSVNDANLGSGSTVATTLLEVRGTLNIGASPGTTTVYGSFELAPTATFNVEIAGNANDLLLLDGNPTGPDPVVIDSGFMKGTLAVRGLTPMRDAGGGVIYGDKVMTIADTVDFTDNGYDPAFQFDAGIPRSYGAEALALGVAPVPNLGDPLGREVIIPALADPVYDNAGMWFGNASDESTPDDGVYFDPLWQKIEIGVFQAAPGDTDGNRKVEGPDILRILTASQFGDGELLDGNGDSMVVWGTGDFDGNHKVEGPDILLLLVESLFGDGTYADKGPVVFPAAGAGGAAKLVVTEDGLVIDSGGAEISGYVLTSKSGILTGDDAENLGMFQMDDDDMISGGFAMSLDGKHSLGDVVGDTDVDLTSDLTLTYTIEGQRGIFAAEVVVPEPGTLALLASGLLGLLLWRRRRSA